MPDVVVMGPKVIMDVSSSIEGVLLGQKTTKQKKKEANLIVGVIFVRIKVYGSVKYSSARSFLWSGLA